MSEIDWSERFQKSYDSQVELREAFARWYDRFYAVFRENVAPWRSKVIDPKVASKAKAVLAKLALADPEPRFTPNDMHDFIKAKNNEILVKNDLKNPLFDQSMFLKKFSVLCDAAITGTGVALAPWTYKEVDYYQRVLTPSGKVSKADEKKKTEKIGYNDFIPVSIFRVFVAPKAKSLYSSSYIIIQDFKSRSELEQIDGIKDLDSLDYGTNNTMTQELENSRNRMLGVTEVSGDEAEIWHCWDKEAKTYQIMGNGGKQELLSEPNTYWHGKYPIVPFYITPRAHNFWGQGLFETSERLEVAGNNLINHFFDQLDLSLNGVLLYGRDTQILRQDMSPGGEVFYSGTKPEFASIPQPDANGFQLARSIINEAIEEQTISQYEVGVPRSQTDKTAGTATGISAIQEAASDLVRFFEMAYSDSCKTLYGMWLSNNQQFLDRKRAVRILGPNGYYPEIISPEDIVTASQLDVDVDVDTMRPKSKEADRALKLAYIDKQLEILQLSKGQAQETGTAPLMVNFYELSRVLADNMGVKEFERIVEPQNTNSDSPTTENQLFLQGQETEPTEMDDHNTHLLVHQKLIDDEGVDKDLRDNMQAHMQMHLIYLQKAEEMKQQAELEQATMLEAQTAQEAGLPYPGYANNQQVTDPNAQVPLPPTTSPDLQPQV